MATPTLTPLNRYLVAIQIPDTDTRRVVEITAPNQQGVVAVLARSNLKYLTPPIDLGPAPMSSADAEAIIAAMQADQRERSELVKRMSKHRFVTHPIHTIGWGVLFSTIIAILLGVMLAMLTLGTGPINKIINPGVSSR